MLEFFFIGIRNPRWPSKYHLVLSKDSIGNYLKKNSIKNHKCKFNCIWHEAALKYKDLILYQ